MLISAVVQLGLALPMVVYFHRVGILRPFGERVRRAADGRWWCRSDSSRSSRAGAGWRGSPGGCSWLSQTVVSWHAGIEPNWRIPTPPVWLGVALAAGADRRRDLRAARWWRIAAAAAVAVAAGAAAVAPVRADVAARRNSK